MLDSDVIIKIYKEAVLGIEPSDTSDEAIEFRRKMNEDIAKSRAEGKEYEFMIPND